MQPIVMLTLPGALKAIAEKAHVLTPRQKRRRLLERRSHYFLKALECELAWNQRQQLKMEG